MAPGSIGRQTSMGDSLWQQCVAHQRFGFGLFAAIHVWLAGVTRGVDQKARLEFSEKLEQGCKACVINLRARQSFKILLSLAQNLDKSPAYVTGGAEKYNHASFQ